MYAYFSALVEEGYFEEIRANLLIVGHTHSNLDQYFSVYSKKIKRSDFIGSPLAMHELYNTAHSGKYAHLRPRYHEHEQLRFVHDWVSYFAPVLNKNLKWYKIPHCFKIIRMHGRAICQYMVFSPIDGDPPVWLPLMPTMDTEFIDSRDREIDVTLQPLICVRSGAHVSAEMGLTRSLNTGNGLLPPTNQQDASIALSNARILWHFMKCMMSLSDWNCNRLRR